MKIIFIIIYMFLSFFTFSSAMTLPSSDIKIGDIEIGYNDVVNNEFHKFNVNKNGVIDNYLTTLQIVSIKTSIKNISNNTARGVSVYPEMYYLMSINNDIFIPGMSTSEPKGFDLKSAKLDGALWVWNKTFDDVVFREVKPGDERKVELNNLDIGLPVVPTLYNIKAVAIRVFARSYVQKDIDYSNNVKEFIFIIPM